MTTTPTPADTVYVCPERDIECGRNPKNWCAKCPQQPSPARSDKDAERDLTPLPHPAMPHGSRDYFSGGQMFDYARTNSAPLLTLLEEYDAVLRNLAMSLAAGGWNSEGLIDPKVADQKIRWGIDELLRCAPAAKAQESAPSSEAPDVNERQLVLDLCNIAVTFSGKSVLEVAIGRAVHQFLARRATAGTTAAPVISDDMSLEAERAVRAATGKEVGYKTIITIWETLYRLIGRATAGNAAPTEAVYQVELDAKQGTWLDVDAADVETWRRKKFNVRVLASNTATAAPGDLRGIMGAPVSGPDKPFYRFWYGHMVDEQMTGMLADVSHSTARYIWDSALASNAGAAIPGAKEQTK